MKGGNERIELLSPAGGRESLEAAVANGADAVYFGAGEHNARRRAENFSVTDLEALIKRCHRDGVKAYLTVNTLVKNCELDSWFGLVSAAYSAGIDAVIIQDVSFVPHLRDAFPDLGIHVSTQAGVFNSYYKKLLSGVDRVILPREFTASQVGEFIKLTGIDVEVFVQGALCFSVGGQCLMSSFLGGRSGNRGLCAQPCRKMYDGSFLMSTKDLCLVEHVRQMRDLGVCSIKIEGRLRGPEYVGAATALYRRALDSLYERREAVVDEEAFMDLRLAFSRGYTGGLFARSKDVMNTDASGKQGVYLGRLGVNGVMKLCAPIRKGDGVGIYSGEKRHGDIVREIFQGNRKVDRAGAGDTVRLALNAKEGDSIYLTSGKQRRRPFKTFGRPPIETTREPAVIDPARIASRCKVPGGNLNRGPSGKPKLLVKTYSLDDAKDALRAGADRVYLDLFSLNHPGDGIYPYIPRCLAEWNAKKVFEAIERDRPASVLCGDAGIAASISCGEVYLDISGNVYNDVAVSYWNDMGVIPVVSPELSFREILDLGEGVYGVYAQGRIPLITTKYPLHAKALRDEKGFVFPVRRESDYSQVLNSVPLGLFGKVRRFVDGGINIILADLETEVYDTVRLYRDALLGVDVEEPQGYTLGNYRKGVR